MQSQCIDLIQCCCILFWWFLLTDTKNRQIVWFHLINFLSLPAFTCVRAIGNLWSSCLEVNILSPVPVVFLFALEKASDLILELSLSKLIIFCLELKRFLTFFIVFNWCSDLRYPDDIWPKSDLNFLWSSSACDNVLSPFFNWFMYTLELQIQ